MDVNKKRLENKLRNDRISKFIISGFAASGIVILLSIFYFILKEAFPAYKEYGFWHMYTTADFSESGGYGIWGPLTVTIISSLLALIIAAPISIRVSFFIHFRMSKGFKRISKLTINILAGVPSIIFGLFAISSLASFTGLFTSGNAQSTVLNGSIMLAIMVMPTIIALVLNQLTTLPNNLVESSLALGNTKTYAIYTVAKAEIKAGIWVAIITALGRAIGETMAISLITYELRPEGVLDEGIWGLLNAPYASLGVFIAKQMFTDNGADTSKLFAAGMALFAISMVTVAIMTKLSKRKVYKLVNPFSKPQAEENQYKNYWNQFSYWTLLPVSMFKYGSMYVFLNIRRAWVLFMFYVFLPINKLLMPEFNGDYHEYFKTVAINRKSRIFDYLKVALEILATALIFYFVAWIINDILLTGAKGWTADQWKYSNVNPAGKPVASEILHPLMITIVLIFIAILVAIPFAFGTAIYLTEYGRNNRFSKLIRLFLDSLGSTPSIIFGIFGNVLFLQTMGLKNDNATYSIIAGALTMFIVILPTFTRSIEQIIVRVPDSIRSASYSLGASKTRTILKIIIPQSMTGLITAVILSAGRIIAETAPVYLTLGFTVLTPNIDLFSNGHSITTTILNVFWASGNTDLAVTTARSITIGAAALLFSITLLFMAELVSPIASIITRWRRKRIINKRTNNDNDKIVIKGKKVGYAKA